MASRKPTLALEPPQSGQRKKGLSTRQRMREAAVELFADRPFDDVQVGEIAERAGVTHGLMFHHFGTKRGLSR